MRSLFTVISLPATALLSSLILFTSSLSAFNPAHHENITREVLADVSRTIEGHVLRFSDKAIDEIVRANTGQDDGWASCFNPFVRAPGGPFVDSRNHFDSENLADASSLLRDRLDEARGMLRASHPEGAEARKRLGAVLHAAQDYYAHSNWAERHTADVDNRLAVVSFGPVALNVPTCEAPPRTGTYVPGAGPTSGYWFGCFGQDDSRLPAGKCYHGLNRDGINYAGTNKDDVGRPFFTEARALAKRSTQALVDALLNSPGITHIDLLRRFYGQVLVPDPVAGEPTRTARPIPYLRGCPTRRDARSARCRRRRA
jgi:hypothetical protein